MKLAVLRIVGAVLAPGLMLTACGGGSGKSGSPSNSADKRVCEDLNAWDKQHPYEEMTEAQIVALADRAKNPALGAHLKSLAKISSDDDAGFEALGSSLAAFAGVSAACAQVGVAVTLDDAQSDKPTPKGDVPGVLGKPQQIGDFMVTVGRFEVRSLKDAFGQKLPMLVASGVVYRNTGKESATTYGAKVKCKGVADEGGLLAYSTVDTSGEIKAGETSSGYMTLYLPGQGGSGDAFGECREAEHNLSDGYDYRVHYAISQATISALRRAIG